MHFLVRVWFAVLSVVSGVGLLVAGEAGYPHVWLRSNGMEVCIYLPDAEKGFYRGTRFDWGGHIKELTIDGYQLFGPWRSPHDPESHDHVSGIGGEFSMGKFGQPSPPGYDETKNAGAFLKMGIGVLRQQEREPYLFLEKYEIIDTGRWEILHSGDALTLRHAINHSSELAYEYEKTIRVDGNRSAIILERSIRNASEIPYSLSHYSHNFFLSDNRFANMGLALTLPFDAFKLESKHDVFGREGGRVWVDENLIPNRTGFARFLLNGIAAIHAFEIADASGRKLVYYDSDAPLNGMNLWVAPNVFCPEPVVIFTVQPGESYSWRCEYSFGD